MDMEVENFVFLDELVKLRKASISFIMSVRPSVCPHEQLGSYWMDFHEILYLSILKKTV